MNQVQQRVPDSTVRPVYETALSAWLDSLGAYNTTEGNDEQLDLMRLLYESDAYYPYIIPFPSLSSNGNTDPLGNVANFLPGETQTGSIQIPSDSVLVSMGGVTYSGPGFKVRVYDKATESDLFYQQFAHNLNVGSSGSTTLNIAGGPFGPYLPVSPMFVQLPGIIQWEITNLDPQFNEQIQFVMSFAVPKGSVSGNVVVQERG